MLNLNNIYTQKQIDILSEYRLVYADQSWGEA